MELSEAYAAARDGAARAADAPEVAAKRRELADRLAVVDAKLRETNVDRPGREQKGAFKRVPERPVEKFRRRSWPAIPGGRDRAQVNFAECEEALYERLDAALNALRQKTHDKVARLLAAELELRRQLGELDHGAAKLRRAAQGVGAPPSSGPEQARALKALAAYQHYVTAAASKEPAPSALGALRAVKADLRVVGAVRCVGDDEILDETGAPSPAGADTRRGAFEMHGAGVRRGYSARDRTDVDGHRRSRRRAVHQMAWARSESGAHQDPSAILATLESSVIEILARPETETARAGPRPKRSPRRRSRERERRGSARRPRPPAACAGPTSWETSSGGTRRTACER